MDTIGLVSDTKRSFVETLDEIQVCSKRSGPESVQVSLEKDRSRCFVTHYGLTTNGKNSPLL